MHNVIVYNMVKSSLCNSHYVIWWVVNKYLQFKLMNVLFKSGCIYKTYLQGALRVIDIAILSFISLTIIYIFRWFDTIIISFIYWSIITVNFKKRERIALEDSLFAFTFIIGGPEKGRVALKRTGFFDSVRDLSHTLKIKLIYYYAGTPHSLTHAHRDATTPARTHDKLPLAHTLSFTYTQYKNKKLTEKNPKHHVLLRRTTPGQESATYNTSSSLRARIIQVTATCHNIQRQTRWTSTDLQASPKPNT